MKLLAAYTWETMMCERQRVISTQSQYETGALDLSEKREERERTISVEDGGHDFAIQGGWGFIEDGGCDFAI